MPPLFLEDLLRRTVARITNEHAVARAAAAVLLAAKKSTPLVFVRHGCVPTGSVFFAPSAPQRPPPPPLPLALTPALQDALRRTPCRFCGADLLRPEQIVWDERLESWAVAQGIVVPYDGPSFVHVDCLPKKPHVLPLARKRLRHS